MEVIEFSSGCRKTDEELDEQIEEQIELTEASVRACIEKVNKAYDEMLEKETPEEREAREERNKQALEAAEKY